MIYSHDTIEVENFRCKQIFIDLIIYHSDNLIISQVENSSFVTVVTDFKNRLDTSHIESFQIINFSNKNIQI